MNQQTKRQGPALQIETLRGLFGDDDESIREILQTYLDDLKNSVEELSSAAGARDRKRTARIAHSMKGASANVGANGLSALCASVEHRSVDAPWEELDGLVAEARGEAAEVLVSVRNEVARLA